MTTIILIVLLFIAIAALIQQGFVRRRIVKTAAAAQVAVLESNDFLEAQLAQAKSDYEALEEGTQEIVDNYENDFLSYRERADAAYNAAAYDREQRERVENELERINQVIENHSNKCETIIEDIAEAILNDILPPGE